MTYEKHAFTDTDEDRVFDLADKKVREFSDDPSLGQFFINVREVLRWFSDRGEFLGNGRNRATYKLNGRDLVVKIPRNASGEVDNREERALWESNRRKNVLAHSWIVEFAGIPILFMEFLVEQNLYYKDLKTMGMSDEKKETISQFSADGLQMGVAKDGTLKFYDYAPI